MTYEESFLQYADDQGQVDLDIAAQFLLDHSTNFTNLFEDGFDPSLMTDAEALLEWIGY